MNKIKNIKFIVNAIKNHSGTVIVCGCSDRTKEVMEKYRLFDRISYIFDNNKNKLQTKYLSIEVIDFKTLQTINDALIIIWGNHSSSFYSQVKNTPGSKILIEYQNSLSFGKNLSVLLSRDTVFEVETPNYQIRHEDNFSHKFVPVLIKGLLQYNLPIETKVVYSNNDNYFKERKPAQNRLLFSYHSVGESNSRILRYKDGYLHNMIVYDETGYSGWSSLCNKEIKKLLWDISSKKADKTHDTLVNKFVKNNLSKYTQPENKKFDFPKKFIFFPLQTTHDSVMEHSYFDPIKLIKKIVDITSDFGVALVIKRHPRCQNHELGDMLDKYREMDKIVLYDGSIHDAISKADTVYTINSGVGFEALLHLKPVVTFGKSDYMYATKNIKNLKKLKKIHCLI